MTLKAEDRQRLLDFYQSSFSQQADNEARMVRWSRAEDQILRFQTLTQVADLGGCSILDVGCGLAELYRFCLRQQIEVEYHGLDLVPEFVAQARQRYPGIDVRVGDVLEESRRFDYVLASGALSFKVTDNAQHYRQMIRHMYQLANRAVAFNMLDRAVHVDNEIFAAYDPQDIADFCAQFAGRVELVTGYLAQDFTIYVYK